MILELFIKFVGIFWAIWGFAIILDVPKNLLMKAALVGGVSGLGYWVAIEFGAGDVMASFVSAIIAATMSHIFARIYKLPVTMFLVGGVIPTVPGAGMYRTVSSFISDNDAMTMYYLTQTLQIAGVIALAIFIVDSLFEGTSPSLKLFEKTDQEDLI